MSTFTFNLHIHVHEYEYGHGHTVEVNMYMAMEVNMDMDKDTHTDVDTELFYVHRKIRILDIGESSTLFSPTEVRPSPDIGHHAYQTEFPPTPGGTVHTYFKTYQMIRIRMYLSIQVAAHRQDPDDEYKSGTCSTCTCTRIQV
jgi:hypothetical protein